MPVDDKCWEVINKRLKPSKKIAFRIFLYSGVAAAITLMLIFHAVKMDSSKEEQYTINDHIVNKPSSQNERPAEEMGLFALKDNLIEGEKSNNKKSVSLLTSKTENVISSNDTMSDTDGSLTDYHSEIINNIKSSEESEMKKDTVIKKHNSEKIYSNHESDKMILAYKSKRQNGLILTASLGTYGFSYQSHEKNTLALDIPILYYSQSVWGDIPEPVSPPDIVNYSAPLSVSLLVRKKLDKYLSIETGLTYSSLSANFKDKYNRDYNGEIDLHYIGIPVNIVADIWNITPQCKLYASSGIMIEKGIKSEYSKYYYEPQQSITYRESIKGFQWSLNTSLGLSYRFYRNWNFYVEPRVSHYFDNDQPLSIRTEKRTLIGLNTGFRYDL
jgi:hypothetical protein